MGMAWHIVIPHRHHSHELPYKQELIGMGMGMGAMLVDLRKQLVSTKEIPKKMKKIPTAQMMMGIVWAVLFPLPTGVGSNAPAFLPTSSRS
jgi:hypothetical protein